MAITEKQLFADLQAGKYKPIYLVTGEINYYIDLVSDYFEQHIVDEAFRDFDQTVVYGRDTTVKDIVSICRRYPMMSPVQLVLVKEAQDTDHMNHSPDKWEPLAEYLQDPLPQTILVLCYRNKSFDKRTKLYKTISSKGEVYEHAKMYDSQIPSWIAGYVRDHNYAITERAATLISQYLGTDLGKIVNEIKKVFTAIPEGSTIDIAEVEDNIGISKSFNVFELQNAIGRRDIRLCTQITNYFAANPKDNPIQLIISNLYNYLVKVMIYHQLTDKSEAAKALGCNSFFVKDYATAAGNYTLPKLATCIGYLHEADLRSKGVRNSGNVTDGEIIKELVFKITH